MDTQSQTRPGSDGHASKPSSKRAWLFGVLVFGGIAALLWVTVPDGGAPEKEFVPTTLPATEVFSNFRRAYKKDDGPAFERWALEISHRRLLEGLTPKEIEEALGSPSYKRSVVRDPREEPRLGPSRLWQEMADYWCYSIRDSATDKVFFAIAVDTPFLRERRLLWTYYKHELGDRILPNKVFVDYCGEFSEHEIMAN